MANTQNLREKFIQARLIDALESSGDYVLKLMKTNKNGIPDLLVFPKNREERPYFIEVKSKNGVVRPMQHFRAKELRKYGIATLYVNDWKNGRANCIEFSEEEVEAILQVNENNDFNL